MIPREIDARGVNPYPGVSRVPQIVTDPHG